MSYSGQMDDEFIENFHLNENVPPKSPKEHAKSIRQLQKESLPINADFPTMGGKVFWDTILETDGWKLQYHKVTQQARVLDKNNIRRAWGTPEQMLDVFYNSQEPWRMCKPGDILAIRRTGYAHYAVYIGNGKVIHYAPSGNQRFQKQSIHEADFWEFTRNQSSFDILQFPQFHFLPKHNTKDTRKNDCVEIQFPGREKLQIIDDKIGELMNQLDKSEYHLYTPEETIARARTRIGETKYGLLTNNCEHFAMWCKTGVKESLQVQFFEMLLEQGLLALTPVRFIPIPFTPISSLIKHFNQED